MNKYFKKCVSYVSTFCIMASLVSGISISQTFATTSTVSNETDLIAKLAAAQSGDTIIVANSIKMTQRIYFPTTMEGVTLVGASSSTLPVLDFDALPLMESTFDACGIVIDGNQNTVKGLVVEKAGKQGIVVHGNSNTIDSCISRYNEDTGIQVSGTTAGMRPANNIVKNSVSYCNVDTLRGGGNADNFANKKTNPGANNNFYDCYGWGSSDDGWDLYENNESCSIIRCGTWSNAKPAYTAEYNGKSYTGNGNGFKLGSEGCTGTRTLEDCFAFDINYGSAKAFDANNAIGSGTLKNCVAFNSKTDYDSKLVAKVTMTNCTNNSTTSEAKKTEILQLANNIMAAAKQNKLLNMPGGTVVTNTSTPTPTSYSSLMYGDLNNDYKVDSADFTYLNQYLMGKRSNINLQAADVLKDGKIDSGDYLILRKYLLKIIPSIPVGGGTTVTNTPTPTTKVTNTPTPTTRITSTTTPTPTTTQGTTNVGITPYPVVSTSTTINVSSSTTFDSAVSSAKSGTKIVVNGTVKSKSVTLPSNMVVEGINNAKIDFSGTSSAGITIKGTGITMKNVEITNAGDNGVHITSSSATKNQFIDCKFTNNGDSGVQVDTDATNNYFIRCTSSYNFDTGSNGGNADGFAVKLHAGAGNAFDGCIADGNSDDGWDFYASHGVTYLYNCIARNSGKADGNGNGFKVGGVDNKTSGVAAHIDPLDHVLINCLAEGNVKRGFDRNNQTGNVKMISCTGKNNGDANFSFPYKGTPSAIGKEVIFGYVTIQDCTSIGSTNNITGAKLVGTCTGF